MHSEDGAGQTGLAQATLWRMERGDARCQFKPGDVATLARFYGADTPAIEAMVELAKTTKQHTWNDARGYALDQDGTLRLITDTANQIPVP